MNLQADGRGAGILLIAVAGDLLPVEPHGEGVAPGLDADPVPIARLEEFAGPLGAGCFRIGARVEGAGHVALQAPRDADLHLHLGLAEHDAAVDLPVEPHVGLHGHVAIVAVGVEHRALQGGVVLAHERALLDPPERTLGMLPARQVAAIED